MPGIIEPKPAADQPAYARPLYLGLIAAESALPANLGPGLDLSPARTVCVGPLAAVVCDVNPADFTGDAGARNLADVEWLAPRAARHEALIERCRRPQGRAPVPVLPARFGTIFTSEASLAARLAAHADTITHFLETVAGRDEWTVRITANRATAVARLAEQAAAARGLNLASGAGYLLARKLSADAAARATDWLIDHAMHALATLPQGPRRRITRAAPRRAEGPELIASAALLASPAEADALAAWLAQARPAAHAAALEIDLTGPWPPYSFCPNLDAPAEAVACP